MQSALEEIGIDSESLDRFKKNVDSGKIALLDTHDAFATAHRQWSGTSKERRWWMQERLDSLRCRVKLVFIEVSRPARGRPRFFVCVCLENVGPPPLSLSLSH